MTDHYLTERRAELSADGVSDEALRLALKLSDAGPEEQEAIDWLREVLAEELESAAEELWADGRCTECDDGYTLLNSRARQHRVRMQWEAE